MSPYFFTECPRDAIQGLTEIIPTSKKIAYIQYLLDTNIFDVIDFGSFVSPKAVPQMADTEDVYKGLDLSGTSTKLLAIVANKKGFETAQQFENISVLGYPFSVSETFQLRNTNATREASLDIVAEMQAKLAGTKQSLRIYISMGFGNPYGDVWSVELTCEYIKKLYDRGVRSFALSDTVGSARVEDITNVFEQANVLFPDALFSAHFHTLPHAWKEKIDAADLAGCRHFDGAILGFGGCPFAKDELTGNMPTEKLLSYLTNIEPTQLAELVSQFKQFITRDSLVS